MAWATSFSRPTKSDANPPPYYLLQQFQNDPEEPYCKGCGRLIDPKRSFGMIGTPVSSSNAASQKQPADKKSNKWSKRGGRGKHQDDEDVDEASAKKEQNEGTAVKFCTAKCRSEFHHKKRDVKEQEKKIEETFVRLLNGEQVEGVEQNADEIQADAKKRVKNGGAAKPKKGEGKIVTLKEVEAIVFPRENDPEKVYGRKKNRKSRVLTGLGTNNEDYPADEESQSTSTAEAAERRQSQDSAIGGINHLDTLQLVDNHKAVNDEIAPLPKAKSHSYTTGGHEVARLSVRSGLRIRPPQEISEVNGSVGGEKGRAERKAETEEMKEEIRQKRLEGDRRAHQKEMVKSVARKGVVFGFEAAPDGGKRKYCECVIPGGKVVEPHFAKGNWGIRWRA